MENRRSFFKGLAAFASGVVGWKIASYIPKKEEPKEELLVSSQITITHEGEVYHPLVVKKTDKDGIEDRNVKYSDPYTLRVKSTQPKIRKANI